MMKQRQWRFQNNSSVYAKRLIDNFGVLIHPFNHLKIHHVSQQIYAKNKTEIEKKMLTTNQEHQ